jgi:hypothetical protein
VAVTERLLHRSACLEVLWHPGDADFLLITFAEMGMRANGSRWWAAPVARKLGLPALGFVAARPNWYPVPAVAAALADPAVRGILAQHDRRLTYGFSMGGYAATRFGSMLGATAALAIAPQWSISPADTGGADNRFGRYFDATLHDAMAIGPSHGADRIFVVVDPAAPGDRWNAARILSALPQAEPIAARGTGHWTASALAGTQDALGMFRSALDGDAERLRRIIGEKRRRWLRRPHVLARQVAPGRPDVALRLLRRGSPSNEDAVAILALVAQAMLSQGRFAEARTTAAEAVGLDAASPRARSLLAEAAYRSGATADGIALARELVARFPASAGARAQLERMLRRSRPALAEDAASGVAGHQARDPA